MKSLFSIILVIFSFFMSQAQNFESCFQENEFISFKIKYLSFNTSTASLSIKKEDLNGKPVFHIKGEGRSSKFLGFFFKIEDYYETYIDTETFLPYRFVRNISEGGYTKDIIIDFDQNANTAVVNDRKHNTKKTFDTKPKIHDMISSFYFLRNVIDTSKLKKGDEESLSMFFDNENFNFKLRFLGKETIKTDFGKKQCLVFRPLVMADRVFKEEESLKVWISDDKNKIPVKIEADLAVGSLTASLSKYSGLKHPFTTQ